MASASTPPFAEVERLIVLVDLAGFAKIFQSRAEIDVAIWLQDFYEARDRVLTGHGCTVLKFMGDACLAVFARENAAGAVAAVTELQDAVQKLASQQRMPVSLLGANLHIGSVIEGEFGGPTRRGRDIIGRGVNQAFLLGRGANIRISKSVYRTLPSVARSRWRKHKPPAIYHLDNAAGLLEGGGKDAGQKPPAGSYWVRAAPSPRSSSLRRKRGLSGRRRWVVMKSASARSRSPSTSKAKPRLLNAST